MKTKRKLISSIFFLGFAFFLLVGVTFGWILTDPNDLTGDEFAVETGSKEVEMTVEISVNKAAYVKCETDQDFLNIFNKTKPSDTFDFRITIVNVGNQDSQNTLTISNIVNKYIDNRYYDIVVENDVVVSKTLKEDNPSILDYFYLQNLSISTYDHKDDSTPSSLENNYVNKTLITELLEDNNLRLFSDKTNKANGKIICGFSLIYFEESTLQGINIDIDNIMVVAN